MRRFFPLWTILALATPGLAADPATQAISTYQNEALGPLAVMREGRVKPVDTLARLEVRKIHGREQIKLINPDGSTRQTWGPVAAFFDWSARPDAWDDEEFLLVEYPPLKEKLLAGAIKGRVATIAARDGLPDPTRSALKNLASQSVVTARELTSAATLLGLSVADRQEFATLAAKLGEGSKFLSPRDLEDAKVEEGGATQSFAQWFATLAEKHRAASGSMGGGDKLSTMEQHAFEAGERLLAYQTIRGDHAERGPRFDAFDRFVPRPHDAAYLKYSADAVLKAADEAQAGRNPQASATETAPTTELERDAATLLLKYFNDLQQEDRTALFRAIRVMKAGDTIPTDAPWVVRNFQTWLRESADWVPMHIVRESDPEELIRAGYPAQELKTLLADWRELVAAETAGQGRAPQAKASSVVAAARQLGEALDDSSTEEKSATESTTKASPLDRLLPPPMSSIVLIVLVSLMVLIPIAFLAGSRRRGEGRGVPTGLYVASMLGLLAGTGFDILNLIQNWVTEHRSYPSVAKIAAETRFNAIAPFYKAPQCYAAALVFLLICLGMPSETPVGRGKIRKGFYLAGVASLLAGIGWEVFGFAHRVYITGWAPVTNMYETVIWVALVASIIGVVLEAIYRKTYSALAASGVALLATVLAYNVPLLDSNIKSLPPVLRSNYWLTIHVMTIVSSYAAFALAMGLGLIGVTYYLTATYRRDVGYLELATPLGFAPFLGVLGWGAMHASTRGLWPTSVGNDMGYRIGAMVAGLGACLAIVSIGALLGEWVSRISFRARDSASPLPEVRDLESRPSPVVAVTAKPSIDEIRARVAANRPVQDARSLAMQDRAAIIKPLANFIYRAMQVGVLLVAAGTFLGGWWADKSWGRFWGWDPKETWALITLLIYIVPLHGRFAGWVNTFGLVLSSVACFLSVLMAWYGVNFVLGVGLHTYGFTEGGGQGVVLATVAGVLAFAGSAWWRRFLAYQQSSATATTTTPASTVAVA